MTCIILIFLVRDGRVKNRSSKWDGSGTGVGREWDGSVTAGRQKYKWGFRHPAVTLPCRLITWRVRAVEESICGEFVR